MIEIGGLQLIYNIKWEQEAIPTKWTDGKTDSSIQYTTQKYKIENIIDNISSWNIEFERYNKRPMHVKTRR